MGKYRETEICPESLEGLGGSHGGPLKKYSKKKMTFLWVLNGQTGGDDCSPCFYMIKGALAKTDYLSLRMGGGGEKRGGPMGKRIKLEKKEKRNQHTAIESGRRHRGKWAIVNV